MVEFYKHYDVTYNIKEIYNNLDATTIKDYFFQNGIKNRHGDQTHAHNIMQRELGSDKL